MTDLDKNGIAEIWVMYENQCTSDVSPAPTKIIMYEGTKKYAIRGENSVQVSKKKFIGGQFTIDDNLKNGNSLFKIFGIELWEQNKTRKWLDKKQYRQYQEQLPSISSYKYSL